MYGLGPRLWLVFAGGLLLGTHSGEPFGWFTPIAVHAASTQDSTANESSSATSDEAKEADRDDEGDLNTSAEADAEATGGERKTTETEDTDRESSDSEAAQAKTPEADETTQDEGSSQRRRRRVTVVSLGVAGGLAEGVSPPGLFGELQQNLRDTLSRLERAADDDDVSAVVLRLRNPDIGRGKLNELRTAIRKVRRSGKRVYADLQFATAGDYLLACACDRIVMPESGTLMLNGVRAELMFYQQLFDKLGVQADMLQVGDFKGAAEPYTRSKMSEPFRRQYELLIDDLFDQMVDTIATDRQLNREQVEEVIDRGLLTADEARKTGLIDDVAYEDELQQALGKSLRADSLRIVRDYGRKKVDTDFSGMTGMFKLIELMTGGTSSTRESRQEKIAVVYAVGAIMTGRSQTDLFGSQTLGCDTIIEALKTAEADDTVAGIVLRIDSPGGSALASDLIWRQIQNCKKPIVASMGDVAASGGYYIAMGCDEIVAEPGTLTGSIGVVGGKIAVGGLMEKVGVTTDVISRGKNSGMFSSTDRFSESEREAFRKSMEVIYDQFTSKAAEGRGMDVERLKELAGGRVWTGRQAEQKGLVDSLGTLDNAVQRARQLAGLDEDDETDLLILPKPKNFFEQLFEGPEASLGTPLPKQLITLLGPNAADAQLAYRLLQEPMLMWLPYRVTIR